MKKFNLHLITPLILTLVLQGCMPDSLTKFKKDPPKKATAASTTTPVVDASGNPVVYVPTSEFYYVSKTNPTLIASVGTAASIKPAGDGSLADPTVQSQFIEKCALDTTGDSQTKNLPLGLLLDASCSISGTPVDIKSVATAFCSDPSYTSQAACEAAPLTWNAATSKCSNPDYQYVQSSYCTAAKNKWYKVGAPIPFRVIVTYHNQLGVQSTISTTVNIASYKALSQIKMSQSDKFLLNASAVTGTFADIVPVTTTTASIGAYARANIISSENSARGVARLVDTSLGKIGINKLDALYVADTTPFTKYGFIAVVGTCSNPSYVSRASCLAALGVWTDSGKIGKIFDIDTTYGILYVENISTHNKYFSTNDAISNDSNGYTAASTITDADDTYVFDDGFFDNDSQYYSAKYQHKDSTYVYETGAGYTIKNIVPFSTDGTVSVANGASFKISPALPPGLSFDTATGIISGSFTNDTAATKYTITATNGLNTTSTSIYLSSISAPLNYALTNKQIITVSNTALFKEGEELYQPLSPPLSEAYKARILKIINGYQMAIETYNGDFLAGASLDNGTVYRSEKAYIITDNSCVNTNYTTQVSCQTAGYSWSTGPVYYNLALTLGLPGGYAVGDYITTTAVVAANTNGAGALARVAAVSGSTLYVQSLTQAATGVSTSKVFYQGDTVNDAVNPGNIITAITNSSMKLTLSVNSGTSATGFVRGADITSNAGAGAYTHAQNGTTISVSDISGTSFKIGDALYNDEQVALATNPATTISAITSDNFFAFERGNRSALHGNIATGNGIAYSISPALPSGLTLNSTTGAISGVATIAMPRKDFLITATNFIGTTTFATSFEVRDYFQLLDKTASTATSAMTSFQLHKVGDTQVNRKCRIDSNDILNATPAKALDVRCFLDGQEEDIYFNKLTFATSAGPGICEYVQYAPYYFNQYSPVQSAGVTSKYKTRNTVFIGCTSSGTIPAASLCEGNYTSTANPSAPNCDEGYLEYNEVTYSMDANPTPGCTIASAPVIKRVNCGGKKTNCIAGPIRDILTQSQLDAGNRSLVYGSSSGLTQTISHSSPIESGFSTNLRNTNGTIANKCSNSNTDVAAWTTASGAQSSVSDPLAAANPYYIVLCRNAAYEIKARIRLTVRDWNQAFRITDGIDNQSPTVPATKMNAFGADGFGNQYNNYSDWDDNYAGSGLCPADPTKLTQATCEGAGHPWVGAWYTGGSCGAHTAGSCTGTWPASAADCSAIGGTWAAANCGFNNQYQCTLHGGTWTGDEEYKFPGAAL